MPIATGIPPNHSPERCVEFLTRLIELRSELYPNYATDETEHAEIANLLMVFTVRCVFDFVIAQAKLGKRSYSAVIEEYLLSTLHTQTDQVYKENYEVMKDLKID